MSQLSNGVRWPATADPTGPQAKSFRPPPQAPVAPKAEAPGAQSQAERDLMRALVRGSAGGKG